MNDPAVIVTVLVPSLAVNENVPVAPGVPARRPALDNVTPLRQMAEMQAAKGHYLFKPAPALRTSSAASPSGG